MSTIMLQRLRAGRREKAFLGNLGWILSHEGLDDILVLVCTHMGGNGRPRLVGGKAYSRREEAVAGPQRDECQSDKSKFLNEHGYGTTMQPGAFIGSNLS